MIKIQTYNSASFPPVAILDLE